MDFLVVEIKGPWRLRTDQRKFDATGGFLGKQSESCRSL
jgi:hypothetical protein